MWSLPQPSAIALCASIALHTSPLLLQVLFKIDKLGDCNEVELENLKRNSGISFAASLPKSCLRWDDSCIQQRHRCWWLFRRCTYISAHTHHGRAALMSRLQAVASPLPCTRLGCAAW